jgi:hypothetical protein
MIFTGFGNGRTFVLYLIDLIILEFDYVLMGFFRFRFEECCDVIEAFSPFVNIIFRLVKL